MRLFAKLTEIVEENLENNPFIVNQKVTFVKEIKV